MYLKILFKKFYIANIKFVKVKKEKKKIHSLTQMVGVKIYIVSHASTSRKLITNIHSLPPRLLLDH